jgi:hypothetical protein
MTPLKAIKIVKKIIAELPEDARSERDALNYLIGEARKAERARRYQKDHDWKR